MEHQGFTESHQILVDVANFEKTIGLGGDIEKLLEDANIIVNRNLLPWDIKKGRHYMNPSGIRLGTSEVTRLGMEKSEMIDIAEFFKKMLVDKKDPKKVRKEVGEFRKDFQEIKYCFQTSNKAYEYLKFY